MTADRRYKPEGEQCCTTSVGLVTIKATPRPAGHDTPCDSDLVVGHHPVLVWFGELIGNLVWRMRR